VRHYLTILSHELRMLLVSSYTYIAAVFFLGVMGFVFASILDLYSRAPQETSPVFMFFRVFPIPVLFIVPLLTMRCLAEERRLGTLETLLTAPVTTTEVVLGKYGAAFALYAMLWTSTGGFFWLLQRFCGEGSLIDLGALLGCYAFILCSGLLFVAVGVFTSSLSRNQAVASIASFSILFLLIVGLPYISQIPLLQGEGFTTLRSALESARITTHFDDFSRGVIDSRQLLFYFSGSTLMLILSILGLEARMLHS
jgi:ABC-2 type transport system permease protein